MIAIVDHQICNLRSVEKAFERLGFRAVVTDDAAVLADAEKIVLPGVGAFEDAMIQLRRRKLVEPLREAIQQGRPFLGICLGLQLLFERSYEHGQHEGLGVLRGEVVPFDLPSRWKVPHMGWNQLEFDREVPILKGLASGSYFYFVHSYFVVPQDPGIVAGRADYGAPFCAMVWSGNLYATQFHPEKSQANGLRLLRNFAELGV
ncbi:MAG: imidazole glycerol phosphate synthase subunit HisH [Planctomycetales bacterium]|nr:imidazole glycerol phosphate synthase subunit HisH [Planctomycetales bacterium]NIM09763.1 imidazole glycerol phosphate synthase subunit HisH [Planctomycetales bacterium]NIN09232.1 imidazole glycerol phosphate synthase subunit HisH [Planctomycetales bacterium]NIN78332.1 imidazole glycerol phosphate synthase subunit HisH [Planctomycetales bacterium]NIO35511.1 imidazole glycerol phosphate synthase subunit HisH [Planctomycetales bacterium]